MRTNDKHVDFGELMAYQTGKYSGELKAMGAAAEVMYARLCEEGQETAAQDLANTFKGLNCLLFPEGYVPNKK